MEGADRGSRLFREAMGVDQLRAAVNAGAIGLLMVFLGAVLSTVNPAYAVLIPVGVVILVTYVLFAPFPGAVWEGGVQLSGRLYDWAVKKKPRWVPRGEIARVWPIIRLRPLDGARLLAAYEITFSMGKGRLRATRSSMQDESSGPRLTEALRAMLGSLWETVYRPMPELSQDEMDRMARLVALSHREAFDRFASGLWLLMAGMFVLTIAVIAGRIIDASVAALAVVPLGAALIAVGSHRMYVHGKESEIRLEAISLYFQVREYRASVGLAGPELPFHRDYDRFEPGRARQSADYAKLERDLQAWKGPIAAVLAVTLAPLGAFALGLLLRLSFTVTLLAVLVSFVAVVPVLGFAARRMKASMDPFARLKTLIREEWRTGTPILPPGFRIPKGYRLFRSPPPLSETDIRRMRIANRFLSPRLMGLIILAVMAAIFIPLGLAIALRLRGGPIVLAVMAPLAVFMGFAMWAGQGSAMLRQLREYEEVSGKRILPPDLRIGPQAPGPSWRA